MQRLALSQSFRSHFFLDRNSLLEASWVMSLLCPVSQSMKKQDKKDGRWRRKRGRCCRGIKRWGSKSQSGRCRWYSRRETERFFTQVVSLEKKRDKNVKEDELRSECPDQIQQSKCLAGNCVTQMPSFFLPFCFASTVKVQFCTNISRKLRVWSSRVVNLMNKKRDIQDTLWKDRKSRTRRCHR
jgi:hypothetical protein